MASFKHFLSLGVTLPSDVWAVLHTLPMNLSHGSIAARCGSREIFSSSGNAEHPPAGCEPLTVAPASGGSVEDRYLFILRRPIEAVDANISFGSPRVSAGR